MQLHHFSFHSHTLALAPATTMTTINILVQTHLPTINNIHVFFLVASFTRRPSSPFRQT